MIGLQAAQPAYLLRPVQLRLGRLGPCQEEAQMAVPGFRQIARGQETAAGVLANRLQQAVAGDLPVMRIGDHQRFVHQPRQEVEDGRVNFGAHGLGSCQRPACGKY